VKKFHIVVVAAVFIGGVAATAGLGAIKGWGLSSSKDSYLVSSAPGVSLTSILTTGDKAKNGYQMAGIPDGLGAFDNRNGTFTVLMNHEIGTTPAPASVPLGVPRAHGAAGAFVSKWVIKKNNLSVVSGEDLIKKVYLWNGSSYVLGTNVSFQRFCSADLAPASAFSDQKGDRGIKGRFFMNGEEKGAEGRAFAHGLDGSSWELPWLGKFSWENALANGGTGDRTIVAGNDDAGGGKGQVYIYAGDKQRKGNPVEEAGLTNGTLFGIQVQGYAAEDAAAGIPNGTPFKGYSFGDVSTWSGAKLETESNTNSVTQFRRPEDGAWDPKNANVYYFVTTDSYGGKSRLWRLTFKDVKKPADGGTIDMLLNGTEGQQMLDNIGPNGHGQIVLEEDIGEQVALGKVWLYDIASDTLKQIAQHDPAIFTPGAAGFITADEESSGVIDVSKILGKGWYLLDSQVHNPWAPAPFVAPNPLPFPYSEPSLVEGGQLIAMHVDTDNDNADDEGKDDGDGKDN
jgi:hypothetical protein